MILGGLQSFLVQGYAVWKVPMDQVSLSWGRAWPAFCGLLSRGLSTWVGGSPVAPRAPPGSPSALGAVALAGAQLSGDGLCLILTVMLELLGASVDLMSAQACVLRLSCSLQRAAQAWKLILLCLAIQITLLL